MVPIDSKPLTDSPSCNRPAPGSLGELFWAFTWLALQGFGGVAAVVERELVEKRHWLTREEFVEDWAVAQILPGPSVINLSVMLGERHFGLPGAMTTLAGMLTFPLLIVLSLAVILISVADVPGVQGALRGMSAVAAGLIVATGLKLMTTLRTNIMGVLIGYTFITITLIAIVVLRVPLAWVLVSIGSLACAWAYRQLGRVHARNIPQ